MKILYLTIIFVLNFYSFSFCQKIKSERTLQAAFEASSKQKKPLMLIINRPIIKGNIVKTDPIHPIFVYVGIKSEDLEERLNNSFIFHTTQSADSNLKKLSTEIEVKSFPVHLFFRPNKELYFCRYGFIRDKPTYMKMLDSAEEAYQGNSIAELERDYLAKPNSNELIRKLIDKRKSLGYMNNAVYIENYANNLNVKDFNDYQTVLYILEAAPYADSKALRLAHLNKKIIDSIFKYEPIKTRLDLNGRIIKYTMNEAIKLNKPTMAQSAASFSRYSWSADIEQGMRSQSSQMLKFYFETNDTLNYFRNAISYYDRYYMNINSDSLRKLISHSSFNTSNIRKDSLRIALTTSSLTYASDLDFVSMLFYKSGTKNLNHINKAISWSKRAVEVNGFGSYYNTLAHLQYKAGLLQEAIQNQQTAIKLIKKDKINTAYFEMELKRMRDRTL